MSNIKFYATTDLYWKTLENYAGHPLFPTIRRKIDECAQRKLHNPTFRNARDKPFDADPKLAGLWHCKLSEELDAVLFYRIHGDTLFLTMVGSHHDYPADGKNASKGASLAEKNRNAVAAGHVDHPGRKILRWARPKDLVGNPLLDEIDIDILVSIRDTLREENDEASIFERLFDRDIMDASEEVFDEWMREVLVAQIEVERAIRRVQMGSISRRDRREISSLAPEFEVDPEDVIRRDGDGFTIELLVDAVRNGLEVHARTSRLDRSQAQIVDDFESDPAENAQRLLVLARKLCVELFKKSHDADKAAYEIERLLIIGEVVLSDPDCTEMQNYASSRSTGYRR
jgi:mRNA-degrading endonuclease YafQ of YafQ-DinJ toxin-antitoxin module